MEHLAVQRYRLPGHGVSHHHRVDEQSRAKYTRYRFAGPDTAYIKHFHEWLLKKKKTAIDKWGADLSISTITPVIDPLEEYLRLEVIHSSLRMPLEARGLHCSHKVGPNRKRYPPHWSLTQYLVSPQADWSATQTKTCFRDESCATFCCQKNYTPSTPNVGFVSSQSTYFLLLTFFASRLP